MWDYFKPALSLIISGSRTALTQWFCEEALPEDALLEVKSHMVHLWGPFCRPQWRGYTTMCTVRLMAVLLLRECERGKADGLAAKSMSVCLWCQDWRLQPDDSSGFTCLQNLSWKQQMRLCCMKASGLSVNTHYVSPVAMMQAYLMTCWTLFEFIWTMPFNRSIPEVHALLWTKFDMWKLWGSNSG